jgi:hypothetical protein
VRRPQFGQHRQVSETFSRIVELVRRGDLRISEHGYDELAADGIFARDIVEGVEEAMEIEHYPDYPKGPCVLVLEHDRNRRPVHVVWGIPRGESGPAVLVTAYRPSAERWNEDFTRRRR